MEVNSVVAKSYLHGSKQLQKRKQTPESAQYGLEIILNCQFNV